MTQTAPLQRPTAATVVVAIAAAALIYADISYGGAKAAALSTGLLLTAAMILGAARRPAAALGVIIVFVPLQVPLLALLLKYGAPLTFVKDLGYVKDAMTLGICLAALRASVGSEDRRRMDALDWFAGSYVVLAAIYLILPEGFKGSLGGEPFMVRLNAWRLDCLFIVLLLAARRVRMLPASIQRVRTAILLTALVMCGVGVWEFFAGAAYNNFIVHTLDVPSYQVQILKLSPPPNLNYAAAFTSSANGSNYARIGSLILDPLDMGFYTVVAFAIVVERIFRGKPSIPVLLLMALTTAGLVLTETRSAVLAGAVAVGGGLWAARDNPGGRVRAVMLVLCGLAVLIPATGGSTIHARFGSIFHSTTQDQDNTEHTSRTQNGLDEVFAHPLGLGLGANPATGQRFATANATTTENSYLQVGTELGIPAMVLFIGMYVALLTTLRRRARAPDLDAETKHLANGLWMAALGLAVGGLFLQVWIGLSVSLTMWGVAGAVIGAMAVQPAPDREPVPS